MGEEPETVEDVYEPFLLKRACSSARRGAGSRRRRRTPTSGLAAPAERRPSLFDAELTTARRVTRTGGPLASATVRRRSRRESGPSWPSSSRLLRRPRRRLLLPDRAAPAPPDGGPPRADRAAVEVGDEVITTGGIYGTVRALDDDDARASRSPPGVRACTVARGRRSPQPDAPLDADAEPTTTGAGRRRRRSTSDRSLTVRKRLVPRRHRSCSSSARSSSRSLSGNDAGARPRPPGRHLGRARAGRASSSPTSLDDAVDIIRSRVDSLGVAEPEISRQGDNIVVDLPGVKDRDKARRLVGKTAELRFRPVLALAAARGSADARPRRPRATTTTDDRATARRPPRPTRAADDAAEARPRSRRATPPRSRRSPTIPTTTPRRRQARRVRRAARRADDEQRAATATSSARPRSPARASTARRREFQSGPRAGSSTSTDRRPRRVQQARGARRSRQQSPQNAGRDRARRRRAVGARVPDEPLIVRRRRRDLGDFTAGRGRRPRQAHQLRRAAGAAQAAERRRTCRRRSARTSSGPASSPASSASCSSRIYMLVFYRLLGLVVIVGIAAQRDGALHA